MITGSGYLPAEQHGQAHNCYHRCRQIINRSPREHDDCAIAPAAATVTPRTNAFNCGFVAHFLYDGASATTTKYTGRNPPSAAAPAPAVPATKYPMNAPVITTGPGVIMATATASTN